MTKILNVQTLKILTNGNQPYKLVSDETGSLHNVVVESKDQTTINIDLSNINFEGIEFQPNSDLGATTLVWIKNNPNIPFNTVEQRVITCTDELKTAYRGQLELLISKGYSIELPAIVYKGLHFTAEQAGSTISQNVGKDGCSYSTSTDGISWEPYTLGTVINLTNVGDKVFWKGNGIENNSSTSIFNMTGKISAHGSAMSLIDEVGDITDMTGNNFCSMFENCTSLVSVDEDLLPATTLSIVCYRSIFENCSSLINAPDLPATTLSPSCYSFLFGGCTSLTTAPELPATELASACYYYMFENCTSLTTAPELPATELAQQCYCWMFSGCSSLINAPELPATELASGCYYYMFANCSSLTTAPELPATELKSSCYYGLFSGCSNLNYIKVGAISWNTAYTRIWVSGVSETGTFVKPSSTSIPAGASGIPTGWTVEDSD